MRPRPPTPRQIAQCLPTYVHNNAGWGLWATPPRSSCVRVCSSTLPNQSNNIVIYMQRLYTLDISRQAYRVFLHLCATVLTHWIKLASVIMMWNLNFHLKGTVAPDFDLRFFPSEVPPWPPDSHPKIF
jgi:hypothetical protein